MCVLELNYTHSVCSTWPVVVVVFPINAIIGISMGLPSIRNVLTPLVQGYAHSSTPEPHHT